ncbi:MAG: hypothetical protein ACXWKM_14280 [Phenylobacterium sp.]
MSFKPVLAGAAAALALGLAGSASAMTGACLWAHLQQPTRTALVEGYQRDGTDVLDKVLITDREFKAIDELCTDGPDLSDDQKERLLAAVVYEHGAAIFLERRLNWDDAAIHAALERLPEADKAALRRGAEAVLAGREPSGDPSAAAAAFLSGTNAMEDKGAIDEAVGFLTSRAMREAIERLAPADGGGSSAPAGPS